MEEKEIRKFLLKAGISSNVQGYFYILDAFEIIKNQKIHTNFTTIYKMLSDKYLKTYYSIERAMRYSIRQAYKTGGVLNKIYSKIPDNSVLLFDLVFNFDILKEEI